MPERGDPIRLAELGRSYEGELPLSTFQRLADSIRPSDASAAYRIRFDRDERGRGRVHGHVRALLPLVCQRCLETFRLAVDRQWSLVLLQEMAEEALLDAGEDGCLVTDTGMCLAELVEDELLLALPVVALHPDYEHCRLPHNPAAEKVEAFDAREDPENPFARLSRLTRGN